MQSSHNERETKMRKYISVNSSTNDEGGLNINVDVIDDMTGGAPWGAAIGYIESSDLDDLFTPAQIMVYQLTGENDIELIDNVAAAFRKILTPRPTVSINGEHFA